VKIKKETCLAVTCNPTRLRWIFGGYFVWNEIRCR